MYDVPSPPNTDIPSGLSPIEPVQCPLDFFTPQTSNGGGSSAMEVNRRAGRTSSDDTDEDNGVVVRGRRMQTTGGSRETDVAVGRVLKDPAFIRKVVDEVSRQLAAQMQQSDVTKELENSPSQGLPSAVLLVVREAANAIAGAHDAEFCQRLQNYFTEQEKQREALEEQFWQRVAEHDEIWTRRVAAVQLEGAEAIQEQQRFLTLGRADAESCGEVRKELLKLCGEVIRTVERAPGNSGVPRASDDGTARQSPQGDTARQDRLELRLETLSAAVNGLYSDVEAVRKKAVVMDAPQDGWRKETEKHIATLQESMADMQEAVAIVARKSRTVEERLDTSKVEKKELHTLTERLLGLERQVESLPSLLATTAPPPLPPPNEAVTSRGSNPMSVEDAMMNAQRILFSGDERKLVLKTDPYAKAVSALCATLQQVNHLYNIGTGTFGGSLQLIFAMPPFSVPSTLASACQVYLREHSAAELKEAVEALDIGHQTAEVLLDCYYWMQSHVLVVGTGCEESLQRSRDDATVVEDLRRGLEGPLSRTGATTMPCTAPPSSAPGHGASFGDLSKSQETPLFHDMAPASGSDAATQTEKIVTALPPPLSAPQTPPPPSVNPLVTCDDGSGQSQLQRPHQHQQQNAEAAAADATTALEALAVGRSPEETESLCGVVYHYHHHHTCGEDRVHAYTPQCSGRGKSRAQNSGSQLNEHDCSEVLERRRNETVQRIESSFLDSSDAREQECPQPVPALNRSHVYRDGKRAATPGCILGAVNRTLDVAPIPSACGNECLPLPSAVSAFTDPQQVTGATGRGQRSLKNPRPFYTAITQQGRQSHRGNNDGLASDSSMRTGHCLGVEGRCEAPGRPQLHHRGLLSTTVKNRDDLLAGVMAAQLQQGPYMYHDERSPTRWRTVTRR
ncbi:Tcc44h21-2.7 [Trypanosoma grayi]|uniref:Tcc44h21-2.7 n=1 Tax=Trypanosoma grayi TaxID=71804 RepID=UPI0004F4358F|nr:Tcc44h21-2.7 [Trypanosoma grayi]KEG15180.1 Tcc44h21-2.7 [Trypanosoma grayi]